MKVLGMGTLRQTAVPEVSSHRGGGRAVRFGGWCLYLPENVGSSMQAFKKAETNRGDI